MGFFSFRRGRKAPSPPSPCSLFPVKSTQTIPDYVFHQPQSPELLDRFSQEVGSVTSASGWVMPDFIVSPVVECSGASSTPHSPKSDNDGFQNPFLHLRGDFDGFEDAPLHLRGGNMDGFDECDPNSSGALGRYTSRTNQVHCDEQSVLRQGIRNTRQITQQVSSHIEPRFKRQIAPRTPEGISQQYPANVRLYPQIFYPPPSVNDSDNDEEADEVTGNGYGCQLSSPIVNSDSEDCYESDNCSDSENDIAVRMVCRGLGRHGRGRIQHDNGHVISCYALPNTSDLPMVTGPTDSSYSEYFDEGARYWDSEDEDHSEDEEEVEDEWIHVRNQSSENSYVIPCYTPDSPMIIGCYFSEYDADSGASESVWNSNRAILLGSDLPDYDEVENWDYIWHSNVLDNLPNQVTEADFWNTSTELRYLIFRFFGSFDVPDSPITAGSACETYTLPEEIDELTAQSLFSPTSVCSDDAHEADNALVRQYHFGPSSPAAGHPFSCAFAWPDPFTRLQSRLPFNWSQIDRIDSYRDVYCYSYPLPSNFGIQTLAPIILDEAWHDRAYPPRIIIGYGPRLRTLTFGTGMRNQFPFTFKHDEPPFPPEGCLCNSPAWCNLHPPLGQFLGKRPALLRHR